MVSGPATQPISRSSKASEMALHCSTSAVESARHPASVTGVAAPATGMVETVKGIPSSSRARIAIAMFSPVSMKGVFHQALAAKVGLRLTASRSPPRASVSSSMKCGSSSAE